MHMMNGFGKHSHNLRVLAPVNGSEACEAAFKWSCDFAKNSKAELYAVYVNEVPLELPLNTEFAPGEGHGEQVLTRLEGIAESRKCKVNAQLLQARHAGPAIAMEAEDRNMDLIIVGIAHNQRVGAHPLGSTTSYLLRHAPCQVIIWRDSAPTPALAVR